ncbi:hypothetical protein L1987_83334 [Smallanthus sonchifolius]|uniref:Uncharacterized protein n=1 Tax=Smallanthus sonchifolius TaxID=185202 RepID=A0ACB8YG53_9ASTR|nr:hypothetical protein L1987_83334 [Smallanthus sonchifolius]
MLARAFQAFGIISDAFVARKKDARGNFFGFVRILNVTRVEEMLSEMNKVNILQARVTVSVAKYDRNQSRVEPRVENCIPIIWLPRKPAGGGTIHASKSYLDALNNMTRSKKSVAFEGEGHLFPRNCIGRSVVGEVKNIQAFSRLEKAIVDWGYPESCLFYIGGMKSIITFRSREISNDFVEKEGWKEFFDSVNVWNGEEPVFGRIVKL